MEGRAGQSGTREKAAAVLPVWGEVGGGGGLSFPDDASHTLHVGGLEEPPGIRSGHAEFEM